MSFPNTGFDVNHLFDELSTIIFSVDENLALEYTNKTFSTRLNVSSKVTLLSEIMPFFEDQQLVLSHINKAFEGKSSWIGTGLKIEEDKKIRAKIKFISSSSARHRKQCFVLIEPAEATKNESDFKYKKQFKALMETSKEGIAIVNEKGKVVIANQVLSDIFKDFKENIVGEDLSSLLFYANEKNQDR